MASQTTESIYFVLIVTLFSVVHSFMDIEELQSINYGINIVKEPIVIPERYSDTAILVTSRHGQQYQCSYPTHQQQKQQKEEEEKIALETGVLELLKPLSQQACLLKTKDWWTYEICYGKHIRQYHIEDGQIRSNVMYLGHFQSDFDWNNETLRDSRIRSKIASGRYHSQYYSNGSKCDLTGKGRETEVRYLCEDTEDDYIVRVDEPETCVYVITVHTPRICRHPHLKSPTPTQPIPIVCAPLLTDHQYTQYQARMEAQRKKVEAARAKAKAEQEQRRARAEAKAKAEDKSIEGGLTDSVNSILKKSLGKEIKNVDTASEMSASEARDSLPMGWKVVRDLEDIEKLLDPQGILSNMDMSHKGEGSDKSQKDSPREETQKSVNKLEDVLKQLTEDDGQEQKSVNKLEDVLKQLTEDDGQQQKQQKSQYEEDLDSAIEALIQSELKEFEQEVKHLRDRQAMTQKRLEQIKEKVKKAVTSQFKDIIEEAEAEVGGEVDEAHALRQLASSLNMLLEKLEHTEKEMKNMDQEIAKLGEKEGMSFNSREERGEEKGREEEDEEDVVVEEEEEQEERKEEEGQKQKGGVQAPPTSRQASSQLKDSGGRWKMRVRTLSQEDIDNGGPAQLPPSKQRERLEHSLKESLQKVGVDPNSVKVHVKIIGGGSSDKDDDTTLHVLSEEDSASFQNMIVAILGGSNEAMKEQKRHDTLEDGYNFMLPQAMPLDPDDDQSDSTSPTSADSNHHHHSDDRHGDNNGADSLPDMEEKEL